MKEWKRWSDQGELKLCIRSEIDTGNNRNDICDRIMKDYPSKWEKKEIHKSITELKNDKLIAHLGFNYFKVTGWGHDCVCKIMHNNNYERALRKLSELGVFHKDMVQYGIVSEKDVKELNLN